MKKILIIILAIFSVVSFGLIGWYAWILAAAPEKIISQTFEIGEQRIIKEDGSTDKKAFIDVNFYNNVFEIKFNYMLDENQTSFYSQGLQYTLKSDKSTFDLSGSYTSVEKKQELDSTRESTSWGVWTDTYYYNRFLDDKVYSNVDVFNYMSGDDYETTLTSSNPIDDNSVFKLQIGDDLYAMKFRDTNISFDKAIDFYIGADKTYLGAENYVFVSFLNYQVNYNYAACDIDYFANLIFEACKSLNAGTSQTIVFEFGNLFEYYEYNKETKQYTDKVVDVSRVAKLTEDVKSYYCINVNIHDADMTSSSQSLFNCYKGNSNYNLEESFDDYFYGRTLVTVDVNKFDFIETETSGSYYLSLNKSFKEFYKPYKHLVEFDVQIDLDYLNSLGIEFLGVIEDSLEDFKIYNSQTIRLVNGQIEKGVVNYV